MKKRSSTLRVAEMSNMTDRLTAHDCILHVRPVTGVQRNLSIVLMLIEHLLSGKACLGRGSAMRGQTILLSPILQVTGNGVNASSTPNQTTAR